MNTEKNCEHSTKLSGECVKCGAYPYDTEKAVTDSGKAPRVVIRFESVSGDSLQKRFNKLAKYYGSISQPLQWTAEEFKKSLISNIERGTIVVEVENADYEAKAFA